MSPHPTLWAALTLAAPLLACGHARPPREKAAEPPETRMDLKNDTAKPQTELVALHGEAHRARIERGVAQVTALWRPSDGDLAAFARESFVADPDELQRTFSRLEEVFEQVDGHFNEITRELRRATDLDLGPLTKVDPLLAGLDPAAHLSEDLFRSKVGFVVLLNFPLTTLAERVAQGPGYTRRQWAETRLAGRFARRVPPQVQQEVAEAAARADLYVAEYNLRMHHLLTPGGERLFPKGLRLISHWNLRDQLKADYADPRGLEKQRLIVAAMERIVTQTIPAAVIDDPRLDWEPVSNRVTPAPLETVEADAPQGAAKADAAPEPDARYRHWRTQHLAARKADPFSPTAPTALDRSFEMGRELPEERVRALLEAVLASPAAPKVAALIEQRLGRKLGPQDLWYNGFQARGRFSEAELDEVVRRRYPSAQAFAADVPRILGQLGFTAERARFLAERIAVDASRGAGHAMPAMRRGDLPRLRTRIAKEGMDYKGYNVAIHELGHNVEQVFSLYEVDHTLLQGVPNNAFTEAMAFLFQARDLELLGLSKPDAESERMRVLNTFWMTREIAGVALVDVAAWHWLYEHPEATDAQFRDAVVRLAEEIWARWYAPLLGGTRTPLLGIYSHLVAYPLYLPDYPLGHLISFQIEEHLRAKGGNLGAEVERMTRFGMTTPDVWMQNATGAPVSAEPLLKATERAL